MTKKFFVFDFDDTLVKTSAIVRVKNALSGKETLMSPREFSEYKPGEGDEFDFRDFVDVVEPELNYDVVKIALDACEDVGKENVFVLTARREESVDNIKSFLSTIGMCGVRVHSVGTGALDSSDIAKKKASWIRGLIDREEASEVEFYDDSRKNVEAVNNVAQNVVTTHLVLWRKV